MADPTTVPSIIAAGSNPDPVPLTSAPAAVPAAAPAPAPVAETRPPVSTREGSDARSQRMYAVYSAQVGGKTAAGHPMPPWTRLPDITQTCWYKAATRAASGAPAEACFEAYRKTNPLNYLGKPTPTWEELPETIRHAWQEATSAAFLFIDPLSAGESLSAAVPPR